MPEEIAEDLSRSEAVIPSPVKCGWGLSRLNVLSCEGAVGFMWTSATSGLVLNKEENTWITSRILEAGKGKTEQGQDASG